MLLFQPRRQKETFFRIILFYKRVRTRRDRCDDKYPLAGRQKKYHPATYGLKGTELMDGRLAFQYRCLYDRNRQKCDSNENGRKVQCAFFFYHTPILSSTTSVRFVVSKKMSSTASKQRRRFPGQAARANTLTNGTRPFANSLWGGTKCMTRSRPGRKERN